MEVFDAFLLQMTAIIYGCVNRSRNRCNDLSITEDYEDFNGIPVMYIFLVSSSMDSYVMALRGIVDFFLFLQLHILPTNGLSCR